MVKEQGKREVTIRILDPAKFGFKAEEQSDLKEYGDRSANKNNNRGIKANNTQCALTNKHWQKPTIRVASPQFIQMRAASRNAGESLKVSTNRAANAR